MLAFKTEIGIYSDRDPWGARVGRIDADGRYVPDGHLELDKEERRELGAAMEKINDGEEIDTNE